MKATLTKPLEAYCLEFLGKTHLNKHFQTDHRGTLYLHSGKQHPLKKEIIDKERILKKPISRNKLRSGSGVIYARSTLTDIVRYNPDNKWGDRARFNWILKDIEIITPVKSENGRRIWNFYLLDSEREEAMIAWISKNKKMLMTLSFEYLTIAAVENGFNLQELTCRVAKIRRENREIFFLNWNKYNIPFYIELSELFIEIGIAEDLIEKRKSTEIKSLQLKDYFVKMALNFINVKILEESSHKLDRSNIVNDSFFLKFRINLRVLV